MSDFIIKDGILKKYTGKDEIVVIPDDVCVIDDNAFMFCDDIKKVTVSKNVTKIGYRAFLSCDSLEKILIPKTVLWIGADALSSCPNLTIYTERGAFAERFAQPYSIPVEYID
jgi:hypothetical protein